MSSLNLRGAKFEAHDGPCDNFFFPRYNTFYAGSLSGAERNCFFYHPNYNISVEMKA